MVRLLLIRHAQSEQNAYMEKLIQELKNGTSNAKDFNAKMRNGPEGTHGGADAKLTSLGFTQADRLGRTYTPLLLNKAKQGKLKVFVSPFTRCLHTADPLLRSISTEIPSFKATILPAIMESGGLADKKDFAQFNQIEGLIKQGKRKEAIQVLKAIRWKPQGKSGQDILQQFPWATLDHDTNALITNGVSVSPWAAITNSATPWWKFGFESTKRAEKRIRAVGEWITSSLCENASGESSDEHVIVFVCHGGTIQELTNLLCNYGVTGTKDQQHSIDFGAIRNTSVTSIVVPSSKYKYQGERPNSKGQIDRYRVKLEQMNDSSHLQDEQLRFWANYVLNAKL